MTGRFVGELPISVFACQADTGAIVWRESIVSESAEGNVQQAAEGAARNNIAQGLAKLPNLDL